MTPDDLNRRRIRHLLEDALTAFNRGEMESALWRAVDACGLISEREDLPKDAVGRAVNPSAFGWFITKKRA